MTLEEIKQLEYAGGGYFRLPGPKGVSRPVIHAPELRKLLLKMLEEAKAK